MNWLNDNEIIINKYTENNIAKYESEIMDMFNKNVTEVESVKHRNEQLAKDIINFFAEHQEIGYKLPSIKIIPCMTPIIEISKNE